MHLRTSGTVGVFWSFFSQSVHKRSYCNNMTHVPFMSSFLAPLLVCRGRLRLAERKRGMLAKLGNMSQRNSLGEGSLPRTSWMGHNAPLNVARCHWAISMRGLSTCTITQLASIHSLSISLGAVSRGFLLQIKTQGRPHLILVVGMYLSVQSMMGAP